MLHFIQGVIMPTTKKRINIVLEDELYEPLKKLAKKEKNSLSKVSQRLIAKALELEEDAYFSKVGDERLLAKEKRVSHKKVWD